MEPPQPSLTQTPAGKVVDLDQEEIAVALAVEQAAALAPNNKLSPKTNLELALSYLPADDLLISK